MVLQKDKDHNSKTYNNAPMPYTERLTWDGVALHAGGLPGYPSSHGCIHLPSEFARRLFEVSPKGMTVVIADQQNDPSEVVHPAALAPVDARKGKVVRVPRLTAREEFRWQPEKATEGPISIIMSGSGPACVGLPQWRRDWTFKTCNWSAQATLWHTCLYHAGGLGHRS